MADTPAVPVGAQAMSSAPTATRIRELNERLIDSAMTQGSRRLDAYEKALTTLVELTENATLTPAEWLSALARAHAQFIQDVATAYTVTLRTLLG